MARVRVWMWTALSVAVLLWGCASEQEREAFQAWRSVEASTYGSQEADLQSGPRGPALDEGSTLSDYLAYAALNNPGLEAAFDRWKAAVERIPQARSLPDPRFNYAYFIQEVETRVGPQRHKFGVAQTFPWLAKLSLRADVAVEAANAERAKYEAAKLKLFYNVRDVYYEYYYLMRAIGVTEESKQLLKHFEDVARIKYRAAAAGHADVIKAQVELGKIENRLSSLSDMRKPTIARLNATLNRPTEAPLPEPTGVVDEGLAASDKEVIQWLKESNPELRAMEFMTEKERRSIELAKQNYFPDITAGVDYIQTDEALMPTPESGKDPVIAMVSVNLPIWYERYKAAELEAQARFHASQKAFWDKGNLLAAQTEMVLFNFRDAQRRVDLYRDTLIPLGRQSVDETKAAYRAGTTGFLQLIDTQRILLEFQLSYERALATQAQRLAELEMLVGRELPRMAPKEKQPARRSALEE